MMNRLPPATWCLMCSSSSSWLNRIMWLPGLCFSLTALFIAPSIFCNSSWSFCTSPLCTPTSAPLLAASCLASFSSSSDCLRTCSVSEGPRGKANLVLMCTYMKGGIHFTLFKRSPECVLSGHLLFGFAALLIFFLHGKSWMKLYNTGHIVHTVYRNKSSGINANFKVWVVWQKYIKCAGDLDIE